LQKVSMAFKSFIVLRFRMAAMKLLKTVHEPQMPKDREYLDGLLEKGVLYTLRCKDPDTYEVWQVGKVKI